MQTSQLDIETQNWTNMALSKKDYMFTTIEEPPSYEEAQSGAVVEVSSMHPALRSSQLQLQPISSTFKPIVIPQTSKSFRGAFFSPFSRAYSPELQAHSIDPAEFMFFLDGLNEAFIAHPAFQITSQIGGFMSVLPFHPVRWAGIGLSATSGVLSAATSWTRAKSYVKAANEDMFLPRGLRCKVLKTKKMMAAVGHSDEVLELPPLDKLEERHVAKIGGNDDPRMRRVRAMGDFVAPLTFEGLPPPEDMENWWKRWGAKSALKKDAKMHKKLMKERRKGREKFAVKMEEAEDEARKCDDDIRKVERKREKEIAKYNKKMDNKASDPEKRAKIQEDFEDEMAKLEREMDEALRHKEKEVGKKTMDGRKESRKSDKKEQRIAQKIYWIVIDKDTSGKEASLDGDVDDEDSEKSSTY
ncbi:hypothetical protein LSUE1_G000298 [Lachnellula suecica]|uniref:Uncharacterized protein n=1 Tax=Lachnellula suecica TaxID=602035 RepID=A0A8T9CJJ0_9HELO|nr:hypothetical protein LSUE1_G000298 [Lachnellula suecica]